MGFGSHGIRRSLMPSVFWDGHYTNAKSFGVQTPGKLLFCFGLCLLSLKLVESPQRAIIKALSNGLVKADFGGWLSLTRVINKPRLMIGLCQVGRGCFDVASPACGPDKAAEYW